MTYILYSDGGAELKKNAASACILEHQGSDASTNLALYLGEGTNNEAEIAAMLLGLSCLVSQDVERQTQVTWVADSEYALKSATEYIHNWKRNGWKTAAKEPVKNQGLWRCYVELSKDFKIIPQHVRGHTGHPENEDCDSATNWLRANADDIFLGKVLLQKLEIPSVKRNPWIVIDGREFIQKMRDASSNETDCHLLADIFRQTKNLNCFERDFTREISLKITEALELCKKGGTEFKDCEKLLQEANRKLGLCP